MCLAYLISEESFNNVFSTYVISENVSVRRDFDIHDFRKISVRRVFSIFDFRNDVVRRVLTCLTSEVSLQGVFLTYCISAISFYEECLTILTSEMQKCGVFLQV